MNHANCWVSSTFMGPDPSVDKIELPDGAIERMEILQSEQPKLFEQYARRDAGIAAK